MALTLTRKPTPYTPPDDRAMTPLQNERARKRLGVPQAIGIDEVWVKIMASTREANLKIASIIADNGEAGYN